jgi:hypothetical protein
MEVRIHNCDVLRRPQAGKSAPQHGRLVRYDKEQDGRAGYLRRALHRCGDNRLSISQSRGLPHPLWTCIFALVGSQDSETRIFTTIGGRIGGTVIGVIVAIAVGAVTYRLKLDLVWQIAVAVAICAVFAWGRPAIQLCMWTAPIIFLSASPNESIASVGFYRGCEVILGILIGGLLLIAVEKNLVWAHRSRRPGHTRQGGERYSGK